MPVPTSLDPLGQLWNRLGWPRKLISSDQFPIAQLGFCLLADTQEVGVLFTDRRTGTEGMLTDAQRDYPSDELVASFLLLVGPIDELVEAHRRDEAAWAERQLVWEVWRGRHKGRR